MSKITICCLIMIWLFSNNLFASDSSVPSIEEIRRVLKGYNSSGLPIPAPTQQPKGAVEFSKAVAIHTKKNPTAAEFKEAARLYQIAADAGIPQASTNLALLYLDGNGVKKDVKRGLALLDAGSQKNDSQADVVLARLYLTGKDVPINEKKAESLLNKAVKAGNKNATAMLSEYKEWKKKNKLSMKQYQDMMKQLQANQAKSNALQQQTRNLESLQMLQGYDFIANHPVPLTNYISPPSLLMPRPPSQGNPVDASIGNTKVPQPFQLFSGNKKPAIPIIPTPPTQSVN